MLLKNLKTGAYLWHKKDSVKPDKGCLRWHLNAVLNNLYLTVIIWLNIVIATSIFKYDLFQMKGIFKYFKHIHISDRVMNKKLFFQKLVISSIIFDFWKWPSQILGNYDRTMEYQGFAWVLGISLSFFFMAAKLRTNIY